MTTSTLPALITGWVSGATEYVLIAVAGLFTFAVGYAVAKGALRFVLKRLHLIS